MGIEKYFEKYNFADAIFDPIPSYAGDWFFNVRNLSRNSKKDGNINLFDQFLEDNYFKPMNQIFKSPVVKGISVWMLSTPNDNKIGRTLKFSKYNFFSDIIVFFLDDYIDKYGKTEEEHKNNLEEIRKSLALDNETLYSTFSNALKEKANRLKDLLDNEINSIYFDAAMKDYTIYKNEKLSNDSEKVEFKVFLKALYSTVRDFQNGILKLGDFFDRNIDYNKFYHAFDPDTFYLLFARIIYEFNLLSEAEIGCLDNSYSYLGTYNYVLNNYIKEDKKYNPSVLYTSNFGKKEKFTRRDFQIKYKELLERHSEAKEVIIPDFDDPEKYKDIELMEKLIELHSDDIKVNWEFLPEGEKIKKGISLSSNNSNYIRKNREITVDDVNERIEILENSGYLGTPIKGLNTFSNYYAFVYANGKVILERFWKDDEMKPALNEATYVLSIDNFKEMSKLSKTNLIEYIKLLPNKDVKRFYHTATDPNYPNREWKLKLHKEIVGTYRIEDAINFIDNIRNVGVTYEK